jgi:hypothetical protein
MGLPRGFKNLMQGDALKDNPMLRPAVATPWLHCSLGQRAWLFLLLFVAASLLNAVTGGARPKQRMYQTSNRVFCTYKYARRSLLRLPTNRVRHPIHLNSLGTGRNQESERHFSTSLISRNFHAGAFSTAFSPFLSPSISGSAMPRKRCALYM